MLSIKEINRRFFESKLAEFVIHNPHLLTAVRQVSGHILGLLGNQDNMQALIDEIALNDKIRHDLYDSKMFGRLNSEKMDSSEILEDIINVLQSHDDLSQVMHIHALFVYRLYPVLSDKTLDLQGNIGEKPSLSQYFTRELQQNLQTDGEVSVIDDVLKLTSKELPFILDRGRVKKNAPGQSYDRIGYTLPSFFSQKMSKTQSHMPGETVFARDESSGYCSMQAKGDVAFVAGSSGHTLSFIQGALLYGDLDEEQVKEYALAVFSYLAGGGNHSFHEVMSVMHVVTGLSYKAGEYTPTLPQSLLSCDAFYLKNHYRYSHFLEVNVPSYLQQQWMRFFEEKGRVSCANIVDKIHGGSIISAAI